jgi:hypothetical protein
LQIYLQNIFYIAKKNKTMADITKCTNEQCKEKQDCKRFTAKDSYMQSYCKFEPENGVCDFKIQVNK